MPIPEDKRAELEAAIAGLEAQRAVLGDAVVETALAALRPQLTALSQAAAPLPPPSAAALPLAAPSLEGEFKLVTLLFADISGFTALAETRDPEAVRSLVNACFESLVPILEKYQGFVDKFLGDAVLALFGAPVAHEKHAEQALRAALEMQGALAGFNARHGTDLGLHFGINTGRVVAGGIGSSSRQDYSVMGDAVNVAARLEDASERCEILVGPDTRRLTAALFDFERLPPLSLKGKSEPVAVYRLRGLRAAPERARGIAGLRSPLVGRGPERERLQAAFRALCGGQGGIVGVVGEAGLGKSRLVAEARREALAQGGALWVEGRALSFAEGISYWAARDVLRGLLGVDADAPPGAVAHALRADVARRLPGPGREEVAPYLARLLEVPLDTAMEERVRYLSAEALGRRMVQAVLEYVRARTREQPLVLAWEDLHWADPSSLALVEALVPVTQEAPLLLLLVFRPEEGRIRDLQQRLRATVGERYQVIELSPLTRDESTQLLHNLLQIENLPEETRRRILDKAEGNAFFLEEVLRALLDAGVVVVQGDRAVATQAIGEVTVPDTLQGVIAARIDRLSAPDKRTLQTASVVGRVFQQRVLAYLLRTDVEESPPLNASLSTLRQREFIRRRDLEAAASLDAEYIFKHVLTQEVTYNSLLMARRKELHRVAGEAIETLFPERRDELSPTLGYHFERAQVPDRALRYLTEAGDRAKATYANTEAIGFYRAALRQAEALLAPAATAADAESAGKWQAVAAQLQENIGDLLELTGQHDEARIGYEDALRCVAAEDGLWRSRLHRKIGVTWQSQRRYKEAALALDNAQTQLTQEPSEQTPAWWHEWIEVHLSRILLFYWIGDTQTMQSLADTIRPAVEHRGTARQRATFFARLSQMVHRRERYAPSEEAVAHSRAALDAIAGSGYLGEICYTHFVLGFSYLWNQELDRAQEQMQMALALSERIGDVATGTRSLIYLTLIYRRRGQTEEVRRFVARSLAMAQMGQMTEYVAMTHAHRAWLAWREGRLEEAQTDGSSALAMWRRNPVPYPMEWMALWPLIAIAHARDQEAEVIEHARGLLLPTQHRLPAPLSRVLEAAITAWEQGLVESARASLDEALMMAKETGCL